MFSTRWLGMRTRLWISWNLYTAGVGEQYSGSKGSVDLSTIHRAYYYYSYSFQ